MKKLLLAPVLFAATLGAAHADNTLVGVVVGGGIGGLVGQSMGGRDGAIVGGLLGAAAGAALADNDRPHAYSAGYYAPPPPRYVRPAPVYYERPAPVYYVRPEPVYYAPPPRYVAPRYVSVRYVPVHRERHDGWEHRGRHWD